MEKISEIQILKEENKKLKFQLDAIHTQAKGLNLNGFVGEDSNTDLIQLLIENTQDLIFIHDMYGKIIGSNHLVNDFLPIQQSFTNMRDILSPEVKDKFEGYLARISQNKFERGYMKVLDKSGQIRILKYNNKLVYDKSLGNVVHGIAHDITDLWQSNKKLISSEESYKGLFNSSPYSVFITTLEGKIIEANATAIDKFNIEPDQIKSKDLEIVLFGSNKVKVSKSFSSLIKKATDSSIQKLEWNSKDKNQKSIVNELTISENKYAGAKVLIAQVKDITENKIAEVKEQDELSWQKAEDKLHKVFDKLRIITIAIDRTQKINYCNLALLKLTGLKKESIIGKTIDEIFVPDKKSLKSETIFYQLESEGFVNKIEKKILSKYGDIRIIEFSVTLQNNSAGTTTGLTLAGEDITENKRVIRALRESNEKLNDIFENVNDLIFTFSISGKMLLANKTTKESLGYSEEEIKNLKFGEIISPDTKDKTFEYLAKILQGEKVERFETVFINKQKKTLYVVGSINCKFVNGEPVEYRATFYDNTYKIRSERAQNLYNSIANITSDSPNLEILFLNIHKELKRVIDVNNFHVALHEQGSDMISFPYYVDEQSEGSIYRPIRKMAKGLSEYTIAQEKPIFLFEEDIENLIANDKIEIDIKTPKIWMGVPLKWENKIIGVIAVKSYSDRNKYRKRHLELLDFVSGQIAIAIERKKNEGKLNEQTARLNSVVETSSHLIWTLNREKALTSFNQNYSDAYCNFSGKRPLLDIKIGKSRPFMAIDELQEFVSKKYEAAFEGIPQHYEVKMIDQNKRTIWWETYLNPIVLPNGEIEEVSGISHDITDKKGQEMNLLESEEKFRSIFESFQDIYYRTDAQGYITMISPSVNELIGFSPEEMMGKRIEQFYENPVVQERLLRELYRYGRVRNFEVNIIIKNRAYINAISNIHLIKNSQNEVVGIEGIARDITFLKKAAEELIASKEVVEKSLKVKESFLANMSHEIRTPMNGIIGMIDLLSESNLSEEQQSYVETVKKSSETLLNILNDILDLSKLEAGKMQLKPSIISIKYTLEKLKSLFFHQAKQKNIGLNYQIDHKIPDSLLVDETRLLQIFSNLTSNAIKFTEKGSVEIKLNLELRNENIVSIKAEVSDTGIGINDNNQKLLFNSFSQVDNSNTKTYGGTGLGLAISKQLCQMMNGEMGVYSKENEGSTFWFSFEAQIAENIIPEQNNNSKPNRENVSLNYIPYILLVDDNAINRKVGEAMLKKLNCRTKTSENGLDAIDKITNERFDLVFMDIQMPVMDGITATKELKKSLKSLPPLIAITAFSMQDDKEKFLDAGLDDYLSKPIKIEKLSEMLNKWLKNDLSKVEINDSYSEEEPIVDEDVLKQLKSYGGAEIINETYGDFINENESLFIKFNDASYFNHQNLIVEDLHTLKGTSGTLGINKIKIKAEELENKFKQNKLQNIQQEFVNLRLLFDEFKNHYENKIKNKLQ